MLESPVRQLILDAPPAESMTFVLNWTVKPDLKRIASLPNRDQRVGALCRAYDDVKREFVAQLRTHPNLVVRDLPGTATVILTGPAEVWRNLAPSLEARRDVQVVANEIVVTTRR
jgi:hypothetical protein